MKTKQESCSVNKRKQQKIKQRQRRVLSNKRAEKARLASEENRAIANQLFQTIQHFFPDLYVWLREIEDFRRKSEYELAEIIAACIAMHLFKSGSRNAFNNKRNEATSY